MFDDPQFRADCQAASYTLGQLVELTSVSESGLALRRDERTMPGITRLELLCDRLQGEPGITAAKVRRLRADLCERLRCPIPHADSHTLHEAADILEGVQTISPAELKSRIDAEVHDGLAPCHTIRVGVKPRDIVHVTGLSCKVIAGTTPTACPDASPVLPPSLLGTAEQAIRTHYPVLAGTTIHWMGHDTGMRSGCRCAEYRDSPFAAPFDQHRWAEVVPISDGDHNSPEAEPTGGEPAESGGPTADVPGLDAAAAEVLKALGRAHPRLLKNVEIESDIRLSKQTVALTVTDLIGKNLVNRPNGKRKGATVTANGTALLKRLHNSSTDHP